jgi:hypothetical protein
MTVVSIDIAPTPFSHAPQLQEGGGRTGVAQQELELTFVSACIMR